MREGMDRILECFLLLPTGILGLHFLRIDCFSLLGYSLRQPRMVAFVLDIVAAANIQFGCSMCAVRAGSCVFPMLSAAFICGVPHIQGVCTGM